MWTFWAAGELYAVAPAAKAVLRHGIQGASVSRSFLPAPHPLSLPGAAASISVAGRAFPVKKPTFVLQFSTMILFPSAKINLGLRVTAKRTDGFHNIESVFYPVPLYDVIEFRTASEFKLTLHGKPVPGKVSENILNKTWKLLYRHFHIPPVEVCLLKNIPAGSGLGGGSADASFFMKGLNDFFQLNITDEKLMAFATQLGSDCPFFVQNSPAFVTGRGEIVQPCNLNLSGLFLILVIPRLHLLTNTLFQRVVPEISEISVPEMVSQPVRKWQQLLSNDFEKIVFQDYPVLAKIKNQLISRNALYASMTGTGSALYGLFETNPETKMLNKYGTICKYKL